MARMTLDLTGDVDSRLTEIAARSGISKTEAIRRALALLSVADDAKSTGNSLAVVKKDKDNNYSIEARLVGIV